MKILFAVSNENIAEAIKREYQNRYKPGLTTKNVYYFNAVIKELQNNKSYDVAIISEDLEPFANNNYDTIDKFLVEKLTSIREEAKNSAGMDIPIILITTDRHVAGDFLIKKLYEIGIYNALIGADRSVENVCTLIDRSRTKNEARAYYGIQGDNQKSSEDDVKEDEIQSILAHYKKLGKNEEKYVESFNNIASQYTNGQLKIIIKFLPLNVKAVLEAQSPKYQELTAFDGNYVARSSEPVTQIQQPNQIREKDIRVDSTNSRVMEQISSAKTTSNVVIPNNMNIKAVKKIEELEEDGTPTKKASQYEYEKIEETTLPGIDEFEDIDNDVEEPVVEEVKKGRGRPKKAVDPSKIVATPKKGRGRPKKTQETDVLPGLSDVEDMLPGVDEEEDTITSYQNNRNNQFEEADVLPGFEDDEDEGDVPTSFGNATTLPGFEDEEQEEVSTLPGFEDDEEEFKPVVPRPQASANDMHINNNYDTNNMNTNNNSYSANNINRNNNNVRTNMNDTTSYESIEHLVSRDKKIVSFIGTSKSGTSFMVNNLAQLLTSMNVNVAILDTTQNKNSFYIYTNNDESLRTRAQNSINGLVNGIVDGIRVNKNLTVYTGIPNETENIYEADKVLKTLIENHSVVLIDCDYETPIGYFDNSQEIYLVQNMDILTMQPLTTFLKELKAKDVLKESKLRVILNMVTKVRGINEKMLLGAISVYKDPGMAYMTDLFNKDTVPMVVVPFDMEAYMKYLGTLVDCNLSLNGYSKAIMNSLKQLASMVYPFVNNNNNQKGAYNPPSLNNNNNYAPGPFSGSVNSTLDQMKNKY